MEINLLLGPERVNNHKPTSLRPVEKRKQVYQRPELPATMQRNWAKMYKCIIYSTWWFDPFRLFKNNRPFFFPILFLNSLHWIIPTYLFPPPIFFSTSMRRPLASGFSIHFLEKNNSPNFNAAGHRAPDVRLRRKKAMVKPMDMAAHR